MRALRYLVILAFFVLIPRFSSAADIQADSRIVKVTVYPGSALVSRTAHLKADAGRHKILFSGIIPEVYDDSLRVSADVPGVVKLFGAEVRKEFLPDTASTRVKELKDTIQDLQDRRCSFENEKDVLEQKKKFLESVQLFSGSQIPKDLVTQMPSADILDKTLAFLDSGLKGYYSGVAEADANIRELDKNIDSLKRELSQVSAGDQKVRRSIVADIELSKSAEFDLTLSYMVRGASWYPLYDARVDFAKSEVELVSYGLVKQVSGEDWDNVELQFSTARPNFDSSMPEITPLFLRPSEPAVLSGMIHKRSVKVDAGVAEAMLNYQDKEEMPSPEFAKAQEKGVAVVYSLSGKFSIKSGAQEEKFPVSSQILKAEFKYSAYPRESLCGYLGSKVDNSGELHLLSGAVNVFVDGDFVGRSRIKNIGPGEKFDLYLGADDNVKVKRELLERMVDQTLIGNIPGASKKTVFKYKVSIENYKSSSIKVNLFEAIPVPTDDRIKVKVLKISREPDLRDWEDKRGIWLWEPEIKSGGKFEIVYSYEIEYPRKMTVEGME